MTKPETPPATDMPPMVDQITRIVHESVVSALMDFEIPDEIIRNDPEIWQASKATADAIIAALPDMVVPLAWSAVSTPEWDALGIALRIAQSPLGEYTIRSIPRDEQHSVAMPSGRNRPTILRTFDNYTDAKEAANAHHRATILAALGVN